MSIHARDPDAGEVWLTHDSRAAEKQKERLRRFGLSTNMPPLAGFGETCALDRFSVKMNRASYESEQKFSSGETPRCRKVQRPAQGTAAGADSQSKVQSPKSKVPNCKPLGLGLWGLDSAPSPRLRGRLFTPYRSAIRSPPNALLLEPASRKDGCGYPLGAV